MRAVLEHRAPINLAVAGVIGAVGLHAWPFPAENVFLAVLAVRKPWLFDGLAYLYATLPGIGGQTFRANIGMFRSA